MDCVKCGEETAKSAVFKMADLHKCEVISIALVFKRSFQQHNKFISKNKVHILVPWHPFSLNIIFIEFRMSGIKEYNLIQFICLRKEGRTDGRQVRNSRTILVHTRIARRNNPGTPESPEL